MSRRDKRNNGKDEKGVDSSQKSKSEKISKKPAKKPQQKKSFMSAQETIKTVRLDKTFSESRKERRKDGKDEKKRRDKAKIRKFSTCKPSEYSAKDASKETNRKLLKREGVFKKGTIILNRYEVDFMLNWGGFGEVYSAFDTQDKMNVAVKVDISPDIRRTKLEIQVLVQLRGKTHIPEIFAYGKVKDHAYIIIQLLGKNLLELRLQRKERKFTHGTLYRTAKQLFTALLSLHNEGWVHRDVKPSNCCIGKIDTSRIYLVDFGMVRAYRDCHGNPRKPRSVTGFRGTQKYASIVAQQKREQGPFSDLHSMIYSLVELGEGFLPWGQKKGGKEGHQMLKIKKEISIKNLCGSQPEHFHKLAEYILDLKYDDVIDCNLITDLMQKCVPQGIEDSSWYDWELKEIRKIRTGKTARTDGRPHIIVIHE